MTLNIVTMSEKKNELATKHVTVIGGTLINLRDADTFGEAIGDLFVEFADAPAFDAWSLDVHEQIVEGNSPHDGRISDLLLEGLNIAMKEGVTEVTPQFVVHISLAIGRMLQSAASRRHERMEELMNESMGELNDKMKDLMEHLHLGETTPEECHDCEHYDECTSPLKADKSEIAEYKGQMEVDDDLATLIKEVQDEIKKELNGDDEEP